MSVIFDQLRISDDGTRMYINAHVNKASYFDNRYLDYLVIKTASQVSETETSPSVADGNNVYMQVFEGDQKEANLVLEPGLFNLNFTKQNFSSDLFFVYIVCKESTSDPCTPCPLSELTTLGVTFDTNILYQKVMDYTKELSQDCEIPVGFTDFVLLWNAFKAAVETEHYLPAIRFYNMMFGDASYETVKPCGCHG